MSEIADKPYLFCLGLGYSAMHVVKLARSLGWTVGGSYRNPDKADDPDISADRLFRLDGGQGIWLPGGAGNGVTHLLVSIPATADALLIAGEHATRQDEIRLFLQQCFPDLQHVLYFSTTGVYGNHDGALVHEESECRPARKRSIQRLEDEQAWRGACEARGTSLDILRLAGIYGPGRNPIASLRAGKLANIVREGHHFGRIHVEDIARTVIQLASQPADGTRIINVCDDLPATRQELIAFLAQLTGLPAPEPVALEEADLSPMARSFWQDSRKVSNRKLRSLLPDGLKYPDFKSGLKALYGAGE